MHDRAMQALYLLALDPIAETTADPNSYGFRKERCCADAIQQCHTVLANRNAAGWIETGLPQPISARASIKPAWPAMRKAGISMTPCGNSQPRRNFACPART